MALEDTAPAVLALLSFLPAYIGSVLNQEKDLPKMLSWALYVLSIFLALIAAQVASLTASRLFGATPTVTEQNILNLFAYFQLPIQLYLFFFGMLFLLGIVVYTLNLIANVRFKKNQLKTP